MKKLYAETKNGIVPIDTEIVEKYNLQKGETLPFTGYRIVDKNGDCTKEKSKVDDIKNIRVEEKEDGTVELGDGVTFTTSEIIDISQGADSYEQNH